MYFLLSGEGVTDLGGARSNVPIAEGDDYEHGPMALFVSQIVVSLDRYSPLESQACGFVSESQLENKAAEIKGGRKLGLPGVKEGGETRFFFKNARVLAKIAIEQAAARDDDVVAILFRDADGTASSNRGEWEAKRRSMIDGFEREGFTRGVAMIPKPKSEAWLICALKANPYQGCDALEDRSGNDDSPDSLKGELEALLAEGSPEAWDSVREHLNSLVANGTVDFNQLTMPSFKAFRDDLTRVIAPRAEESA